MTEKVRLSQIKVKISPLEEKDIEHFDRILESHVWDRKTGKVLRSEIASIKGYMRGEKDEYGRTRTYLVAKDEPGRLLGCMAYAVPDPDMIEHFKLDDSNNCIELLNAFVSSDIYRGGGVGRKLLEAVCEAGKNEGKKQLLIHSGPRYKESWGFYDKITDEQTDFILNKYGKGRHAKTWKIDL